MFEEHTLPELLADFFQQKGYLSIPCVGRLALPETASPEGPGTAGAPSFRYDPREAEDPELVAFITERTRKMSALAASDLQSFAGQAREMLGMGQSFSIGALATLIPDGHGGYRVQPGKGSFHAASRHRPPAFRTDRKPPVQEESVHATGGRRPVAAVLMTAISVCIGAFLVYLLVFHRHAPAPAGEAEKTAPASRDVPATAAAGASRSTDTGLLHYEAVFEHAVGDRALSRYRQLTAWGHQIVLHTADSVHYSLAIRFDTPAGDTTAIKDSIAVLYGHPVDIRLLP